MSEAELFHQTPLWDEGGDLPGALEALFTAAGEVLDLPRLRELTGLGDGALMLGIEKLQERLQGSSGLRLLEVAGGWRMATSPLYRELIAKLVTVTRSGRLTPAQIETLAIIAYRQPVTRGDIEDIRGVAVSPNILKTLETRGWIDTVGHRDAPGRPALYATTRKFLDDLGLRSLSELPPLTEIEKVMDLADTAPQNAAPAPEAEPLAPVEQAQQTEPADNATGQIFAE